MIDLRSLGVRCLLEAGAGLDVLEFAINTNGDRTVDYYVFKGENGAFASTGPTLTYVQAANSASASAFLVADADLNSGNMILSVPLLAQGLYPGTTVGFSVLAADNYFAGIDSNAIEGMLFTPGNERFGVLGLLFGEVASRSNATLGVKTATPPDSVSSERGLLLMFMRIAGSDAAAIHIR